MMTRSLAGLSVTYALISGEVQMVEQAGDVTDLGRGGPCHLKREQAGTAWRAPKR